MYNNRLQDEGAALTSSQQRTQICTGKRWSIGFLAIKAIASSVLNHGSIPPWLYLYYWYLSVFIHNPGVLGRYILRPNTVLCGWVGRQEMGDLEATAQITQGWFPAPPRQWAIFSWLADIHVGIDEHNHHHTETIILSSTYLNVNHRGFAVTQWANPSLVGYLHWFKRLSTCLTCAEGGWGR